MITVCDVRGKYLTRVCGTLVQNYPKGKGAADNDKNRRLAEKAPALYLRLRAIMKDGSQERGWKLQGTAV